jgi:hypothetical protein
MDKLLYHPAHLTFILAVRVVTVTLLTLQLWLDLAALAQ